MPEMKRTVKDSVFTYLFSDPTYARELYLYLHPEDTSVTEADCKLVTIQNILSNGQYNDLGLLIRDTLIILAEAQSTFSPNLPIRIFLYMAQEYKDYIDAHKLNLYSTKAVTLPKAELYMVYSGNKKDVPEVLRLSDLCGGEGSIEVTVKVLRGGDSSIVGQYVEFCKIADEQRALYGLTKKAIQETIRICLERGILVPFLTARQKEVIDIMEMLFSQEQVWELDRRDARQEGEIKGLFRAIKSLIETTGMSVEQAMTALQVAEKDRPQYLDMLGSIGQ
ncbi:MAG: hypothetical protein HDT14_01990 [Oscillibacter sp.]|nr:hypothetical protein [Oscillibacter sp.]